MVQDRRVPPAELGGRDRTRRRCACRVLRIYSGGRFWH
jgi:hypothetical protein